MDAISDNWQLILVGVILLVALVLLLRYRSANKGQKILLDVDTSIKSGLATRVPSSVRVEEDAPVPASIPTPPAATGDDLTLIKGVGPKIATLLNAMGVTSYAQIAAWTDEDLEKIDASLGTFAGRASRDCWVDQCRLLASGDKAGFMARYGALGSDNT